MSYPKLKKPYHWRDQKYHHKQYLAGTGETTFTLKPDVGQKIKLIYGYMWIDCSADVANRQLEMEHRAQNGENYYQINTSAITASQDGQLIFAPTMGTGANKNTQYIGS